MTAPRLMVNHGIREVHFEDEALVLEARYCRVSHHDTEALVTTFSLVDGKRIPVYKANLLLMGPNSRSSYIKGLAPSLKGVDCAQLVNEFTYLVDADIRQGKDATLIRDAADITPEDEHVIRPLIPLEDTTVFYGDGDSLKTFTALALAASSHLYLPLIAGLEPQQSLRWGILDAESSDRRMKQRMTRFIPAGTELPSMWHVDAQGMPLEAQVERVGNICADKKIEALIYDSAVPLCAGNPSEAESAGGFFRAIKALGLKGNVVIAHVTKTGDSNAPYGSAFFRNTPRTLFYFQAPPRNQRVDGEPFQVGIFSKKSNDTGLISPLFLSFKFTLDGRLAIKREDVEDAGEFKGNIATWEVLKRYVRGGKHSYQEAAAATGIDKDAIGKEVRRHSSIFGREDRVIGGLKKTYFWLLDDQHVPDHESPSLDDSLDFIELDKATEQLK